MRLKGRQEKIVPHDVVGSTNFGRYPKISLEQTYNMIISDDWLVPYAGYNLAIPIVPAGTGRGLYKSSRLNSMIAVIDNDVYVIDTGLNYDKVGEIETFVGDVFLAENTVGQIAICDKSAIWIYNYVDSTFLKANLDFIPGYVAFQDSYFVAPESGQPRWRLSASNDGLSWPPAAANVGLFQTTGDNAVAVFPIPEKGNLLFVMGNVLTEPWVDTAANKFPYQKTTQYNIDYGCVNPATIAFGDKFVIWLAINQKSGPVIMLSEGGPAKQISNEGFNFRFANLVAPQDSVGFLFKQDGHLIYQLTFYNPQDNLSLIFDFNTEKFFTVTDGDMNYHIARHVVFFNNTYYFISLVDGNIYEFSTKFFTADGDEIPRIRITQSFKLPRNTMFVVPNINYTVEQGQFASLQRADLAISTDGGYSFGSYVSKEFNEQGYRSNKLDFYGLGMMNELIVQHRWYGTDRYVVGPGTMGYYQ